MYRAAQADALRKTHWRKAQKALGGLAERSPGLVFSSLSVDHHTLRVLGLTLQFDEDRICCWFSTRFKKNCFHLSIPNTPYCFKGGSCYQHSIRLWSIHARVHVHRPMELFGAFGSSRLPIAFYPNSNIGLQKLMVEKTSHKKKRTWLDSRLFKPGSCREQAK